MRSMTEQTNPEDSKEEKPRMTIADALRKPFMALAALAIIWFVFGEIIPRSFFAEKSASSSIQTSATTYKVPKTKHTQKNAGKKIAALNKRIDQLEAKLKTYEDIITELPAQAPPDSIITTAGSISSQESENRFAMLEEKITSLQQQLQTSSLNSDNKVMTITAFAQMKEAALRGKPFLAQYNILLDLTKERADISKVMQTLKISAKRGVITTQEAYKKFETLVPQALARYSAGSVMGNVQSLFTIRKVGNQPGMDDQAIIARAETFLKNGDFNATLNETKQLSAHAKQIFSDWEKNLRYSENARKQLDKLQQLLATTKPAKNQTGTTDK